MFFVNKSDRTEVIELIYSGSGFCIVVDQNDTIENNNVPVGRILRYGKKELKRKYKKVKDNYKYIKMKPTSEEIKEEIINTFEVDKIGILEYTEDYIENNKKLEKQEEIKKQTEAEYRRMLKTLADAPA